MGPSWTDAAPVATARTSCTDCDGNLEDGQRWRCRACLRAAIVAQIEAAGGTVRPSDIQRAGEGT